MDPLDLVLPLTNTNTTGVLFLEYFRFSTRRACMHAPHAPQAWFTLLSHATRPPGHRARVHCVGGHPCGHQRVAPIMAM